MLCVHSVMWRDCVLAVLLFAATAANAFSSCDVSLCANGATCTETPLGYSCTCSQLWVGTYCNITKQCDAAAFNTFAPLTTIPGATAPGSVGLGNIVMTNTYVFTPRRWRLSPLASYLEVSHRYPSTDAFNTQRFYQTLSDVNLLGNNVFAATDTLLALSSGYTGGSNALLYRVSPANGTWVPFKTLAPRTVGNSVIGNVVVNERWMVLFTNSGPPDQNTIAAEFYTVGADGYTTTYNSTVLPGYGSLMWHTAAMTPGTCVRQYAVLTVQGGVVPHTAIVFYFNADAGTWNATQYLTLPSINDPSITMTCDVLLISDTSAVWYYRRNTNDTQWTAPTQLAIPGSQSFDFCGQSVSAHGSKVVIGCPQNEPGNADIGRAVTYRVESNLTLTYTGSLNNYCSSTFVVNADVRFGSAVATHNNQVVAGVPNVNSGAGVLMQFGEPCGDSICVAGNTCVQSPFGAQQMCVCTVTPSPCAIHSSAATKCCSYGWGDYVFMAAGIAVAAVFNTVTSR